MNGKSQILIIGVAIVCLVLVTKLFFLQIVDEEYKISAENNAYKYVTIYPVRGLILDRNGNILVSNRNSYDIMVTPVDLQPFDTAALCRIFSINKEFVREKIAEYRKNRRKIGYQSVVFLKQVSEREYGVFLEQSYKFPGFSGVSKSIRDYPYNAGANLFGYTTEVSEEFLEKNPHGGVHHVAFNTDDIVSDLAHAKAQGVGLINEEPKIGAHAKKIAFLHPKFTKGVLTEFCQDGDCGCK